ncbi:MAG: hypothetical protein HY796_13100 [Elusimicrobia bacterium]|nr:hypothetical protein [Elusimicrobiota bacterium]
MEEPEHKNFFRTHKALSILPLLLLSAGGFYYIQKHKPEDASGKAPQNFNFSPPRLPGGAGSLPSPAAEEAKSIAALDIQGPPEFKSQVTRALKLIWISDRNTFLFIKKYIFVIRNDDKTDFHIDGSLPVAAVSNAHAFRSLPWCAGIIAHQAFHSYAAFGAKKKKAGRAPPPPGASADTKGWPANPLNFDYTSLDSILKLEAKAAQFQLEILEKTGASRLERNEVAKRKPRDFKTAHDGKYLLVAKP